MPSSANSLPISPPVPPAPTHNTHWTKPDDDWFDWSWWDYNITFCPIPFLDSDPQRSGFTNNSQDQDRSIAQISSQESPRLRCPYYRLDSSSAISNLASDPPAWPTCIGLEPMPNSHDFSSGAKSLYQPEFISTLPMPDRGGASTELEFASQSSFSANLPTTTLSDLPLCVDNEKSDPATSETNLSWMILDFDLQHKSTSHGILGDKTKIQCHECNATFPSYTALDLHAKQTLHAPFACRCSKSFSRQDCLDRHLREFNVTALFPCPYCDKYDGTKAFKRRDHLTQHLRGHHRIKRETVTSTQQSGRVRRTKHSQDKTLSCPHENCSTHRDPDELDDQRENAGFTTQAELTKHLRNAHDESPFPCGEPGCSRKRKHGFFRERDLLRHRKGLHSK